MKHWLIIFSLLLFAFCAGCKTKNKVDRPDQPIVILFENDVHCAVDGYAKLVSLREEQRERTPYTATVSSGDYVQGDVIGSLSKGESIIELMNEVGYDVVTLGNHEFDYGMSQLFKLRDSLEATMVSANFCDFRTGELIFPPYEILSFGEVDIAFMGFTTTTTPTMVAPHTFLDENKQIAYGFYRPTFYENAQRQIDKARAEGADYVVVLSHLGDSDRGEHASSVSLIGRTTGIDVVLDGHDHQVIPDSVVYNRKGEPVLLASTGLKFQNIGLLTLSEDGMFTSRLVPAADMEASEEAQALVESMKEKALKEGERKVGVSEVHLSPDDASGNRLVRSQETNIGNFCADAFRVVLKTDVAMVNGGGIRADLPQGDVTYNDLCSVFPFNNTACTASLTGQQLLDALEFSVCSLPGEDGSFMQVSGVKFEVDASVPSPVVVDGFGLFQHVGEDARRVSRLQIWDKNSQTYLPVDLEKRYTIASFNYMLKNLGCAGIFRYSQLLEDNLGQDVEVLASYIETVLNGRIGKGYSEPEGRIVMK